MAQGFKRAAKALFQVSLHPEREAQAFVIRALALPFVLKSLALNGNKPDAALTNPKLGSKSLCFESS